MSFHSSDLLQGLHGPPGDKGNRVSLTPHTWALVTNVFMMWWNDQWGIPDPTWHIQFSLINHCKLKGFLARGLLWHAGSLGPGPEMETYFSAGRGEAESHGGHQISIAIQWGESRAQISLWCPDNGPLNDIFKSIIA